MKERELTIESIPWVAKLIRSKSFLKYFKNTSWLFVEQVITMGISFVVYALIADYLGPAGLGILSYGQSFGAFMVVLARLGLDSIVVRNLVKSPESTEVYLGTAFIIKLVSSILSLGILAIFLFLASNPIFSEIIIHEPIKNYVILLIGAGTIFQAFNVIDFFFQSKVQVRHGVRVRLVQFCISTLLRLLIIFFWKGSVLSFAIVLLLNEVLIAAGLIFTYQLKFGSLTAWRFDKKIALELVRDSWPLVLSAFAAIFYMKIDVVMITNMLGNKASGIYSVSARLTEIWYVIPSVITNSLFPAIVNARNKDRKLYKTRVQSLYDLMLILALGVALPTVLLGDWLDWGIVRIFGTEYSQVADILRVQIWSSVFVFLGVASNYWLLTENLQRIGLYRILMGAVVNVALNWVLLPHMGIMGAAIATLISQVFASYLGYLISRKTWVVFRMLTQTLSVVQILKRLKFFVQQHQ